MYVAKSFPFTHVLGVSDVLSGIQRESNMEAPKVLSLGLRHTLPQGLVC